MIYTTGDYAMEYRQLSFNLNYFSQACFFKNIFTKIFGSLQRNFIYCLKCLKFSTSLGCMDTVLNCIYLKENTRNADLKEKKKIVTFERKNEPSQSIPIFFLKQPQKNQQERKADMKCF